jgi:hypothetical protein
MYFVIIVKPLFAKNIINIKKIKLREPLETQPGFSEVPFKALAFGKI